MSLTTKIRDALRTRYNPAEFAYFEELQVDMHGTRRMDMFVMNMHASQQFRRTVLEIKVSRADYNREKSNLSKTRQAITFANEFYYVTPKGLLKPEELPNWAGLIEYDEEKHNLRVKVTAAKLESFPPSWDFVASLLRRVHELERHTPQYTDLLEAALRAVCQGAFTVKYFAPLKPHLEEMEQRGFLYNDSELWRDPHFRVKDPSGVASVTLREGDRLLKGTQSPEKNAGPLPAALSLLRQSRQDLEEELQAANEKHEPPEIPLDLGAYQALLLFHHVRVRIEVWCPQTQRRARTLLDFGLEHLEAIPLTRMVMGEVYGLLHQLHHMKTFDRWLDGETAEQETP